MEKTYHLYTGLAMDDVTYFVAELMQSCISFEYEYEAGTITIKNVRQSEIDDIDSFIKENKLDIHGTEEEY